VTNPGRLADLLRDVTRDRAVAYAALTETRATLAERDAQLHAALLELNVAHELLAYHGLQEAR